MKLLLITIFMFSAIDSYCQTDSTEIIHGDTVYLKTDKAAQYKGGKEGLAYFLQSNFGSNIPVNTNTSGYYFFNVKFIVWKDGTISDIDVEGSLGDAMNQELIKVMKKAHKFKPAVVNGTPVNSYYYQPITFSAQ
jgi:protein TonB